MIEAILEPFKYDFMIRSLVTAIASGTMLSLLGPFAVNRNMGFMADAMAHATLPIIAVGVFFGFSISELGVPASVLIAIFLGFIIKLMVKQDLLNILVLMQLLLKLHLIID